MNTSAPAPAIWWRIRDRVLAHLTGSGSINVPPGAIAIADDITPSLFLATRWSGGGIALRHGSATSHVAMLARSRGVPMVVGVGAETTIAEGEAASSTAPAAA